MIRSLAVVSTIGMVFAGAGNVHADDAPTVVTVDMNEYSFQVDNTPAGTSLALKAGTLYDLTIKNIGEMGHEIWFGRNTKLKDGRVDGYSDNLFTGVDMAVRIQLTKSDSPLEVDTTAFYEVFLNPKEAATLEFTLPKTAVGKWELGCFQPLPMAMTPVAGATAAADAPPQPSHYDVGMKLPMVVS